MLKRISLSFIAGIVLTVLLLAAPSAKAACQGFCADRIISPGCGILGYAGCTIYYDANDNPTSVDCFYAGVCDLEIQ